MGGNSTDGMVEGRAEGMGGGENENGQNSSKQQEDSVHGEDSSQHAHGDCGGALDHCSIKCSLAIDVYKIFVNSSFS